MIEIISPDDFHHHLRDGSEVLTHLLRHVTKQFERAIVMPNLQPPVRTLLDAQEYHSRIIKSSPVALLIFDFIQIKSFINHLRKHY